MRKLRQKFTNSEQGMKSNRFKQLKWAECIDSSTDSLVAWITFCYEIGTREDRRTRKVRMASHAFMLVDPN
jgi:hypothetical protein